MRENPSYQQCIACVEKKAKLLKLPSRLCLATVWIESDCKQFDLNGQVLCNPSGEDFGIMQINIGHKKGMSNWGWVEDWESVLEDWAYNLEIGLEILKNCYELANTCELLKENEEWIAQASYSAYNGGPKHLLRFMTPVRKDEEGSIFYDRRDMNFIGIYRTMPWKSV